MENDPNKKESKGKRILKKALRRNSKTSNGSLSESNINLTRSKSFENKRVSIQNDTAPLPTPDGPHEKPDVSNVDQKCRIDEKSPNKQIKSTPTDQLKLKKLVDIQEELNTSHGPDVATTSKLISGGSPEPGPSRKNLKRKVEDEEGVAGTSATSGASTNSDNDADDKDPSKDKKKKNRCAVCRKKVGLTGFECRCGGLFCAVHRYSDKHECSFDYRELGAQEIRRNNPVVVSQKIHKI